MGLQGFLLTPQVLWTGLPGPNLHLLVACAILDMERDTLMLSGFGSNEILKVRALPTFCSDLDVQCMVLALGWIGDHFGGVGTVFPTYQVTRLHLWSSEVEDPAPPQ